MKVLTFNLFWWNLFGVRGGNGASAGRLVRETGQIVPYDVLGFQECRDVHRVLQDAGLASHYTGVQVNDGDIALGLAFRTNRFDEVSRGANHVAEDDWNQYYGRRGVQWIRLKDKGTDRIMFVLNHHGPLPVNTGGICGGRATAFNLLRIIAENVEDGDAIILIGDLNAGENSPTQSALQTYMHRVIQHWVDAIFASCAGTAVKHSAVLGNGGSDHNAVYAIIEF